MRHCDLTQSSAYSQYRVEDADSLQPAREDCSLGNNGGIALRPRRNHPDFDLEEVGDKAEIFDGGFGQLACVFDAVGRLAPTWERLVLRLDALKLFGQRGHFIDRLAFIGVTGADLNFALRVEDVELGDHQRIDAVDHLRVAQHGEVKPAATARASGDSAKFLSAFANRLRVEIGHFGWKWAATNARCVCLRDSQDMLDLCGRNSDADRCAP